MVCLVVEQGWSIAAAASAMNTSEKTCGKWVSRYRESGESGLRDRSSAPRRQARQTCERRVECIRALRRLRFTGAEIAELLAMPLSTVSGILKREAIGKLGRLGLEPAERYERARPGELIHIDIKKLGRIHGGAGKRVTGGVTRNGSPRRRDRDGVDRCVIGWDYVHVAVDDDGRVALRRITPERKGGPPRLRSWAARSRSTPAAASASAGACPTKQLRPRPPPGAAAHAASATAYPPYAHRPTARPKRFIPHQLGGGAYGAIYGTNRERTAALTAGSTTTTITDDTQPSATNRPSPG